MLIVNMFQLFTILMMFQASQNGQRSCESGKSWIYHCHLYTLQAANCCRNSRLVVDEDDLMWFEN